MSDVRARRYVICPEFNRGRPEAEELEVDSAAVSECWNRNAEEHGALLRIVANAAAEERRM